MAPGGYRFCFSSLMDFMKYHEQMKFNRIQFSSALMAFFYVLGLALAGCSNLTSENEKLKDEITDVNAENEKLKKELNTLKTENSKMHVRIAQLHLEIAALYSEIQNMQRDLSRLKEEEKRKK